MPRESPLEAKAVAFDELIVLQPNRPAFQVKALAAALHDDSPAPKYCDAEA